MVFCRPGAKYLNLIKKYSMVEKNDNGTDNGTDGKLVSALKTSSSSKQVIRMLEIITLMKSNNAITVKEIVRELESSVRTIKRDIEKLKELGVIKRDGNSKSGKWIVTE